MDDANTGRVALGVDIGGTSVKVAVMAGERVVWEGKSGEYARPGRAELAAAIGGMVRESPVQEFAAVGVCAPGLRDKDGVIVRAVNVPGLEGMRVGELVEEVGRGKWAVGSVREYTDAFAGAVDFWRVRRGGGGGRLLALSLGTGVGACVLDDAGEGGVPRALVVTGRGPGQIGQMDVMVEEAGRAAPVGPDGGRGTLEAYVGLPALRARYGDGLAGAVGEMRVDEAPLAALVKALRVCHAIYTPERVVLLGGVGMRLGPRVGEIRAAVADGLTTLAREGWRLEVGETEFHAARGAAWMAGHPMQG